MTSKIRFIRMLSLLVFHCRKGILVLKEIVISTWGLAPGMVLPPACTVISAYMAAWFPATKRTPFVLGMHWEGVCMSLPPNRNHSTEVYACRNPPSTVCPRAPVASPWTAHKQSRSPHQTSVFWTYLLDIKNSISFIHIITYCTLK